MKRTEINENMMTVVNGGGFRDLIEGIDCSTAMICTAVYETEKGFVNKEKPDYSNTTSLYNQLDNIADRI